MWNSLLNLLFLFKILQIFNKYGVRNIVRHEDDLYAVYYDEVRDRIHHLPLSFTVVREVDGVLVHKPILGNEEEVGKNWMFLDLSEDVKPVGHYSEMILKKLVEKVRLSMRGY